MIRCYSIILALTLKSTFVLAQQAFSELSVNNIRARVFATGDLFENMPSQTSGFEVPVGTGLNTMYAGNLWIGGVSPDMQLKIAAETYRSNLHDWFNGPLSIDGLAEVSVQTQAQYDQVFLANSQDVANHLLYYELLGQGATELEMNVSFPNGYVIPQWINSWPAHGDTESNQSFYLAPFFDSNQNGSYNPEAGDAPVFCGDQCLYIIFNDKGNVHSFSQAQPIGLEVHAMVYAFNGSTDSMLDNTVFVKYKIINRGSITLTDTYAAIWTDFDIGNYTDDYVRTDVKRGAVVAYNGDAFDEQQFVAPSYGDDLPAQALVILGGPSKDPDNLDNQLPDDFYSTETNSYASFGPGHGDDIVDNERLGLTGSMFYYSNGSGATGEMSSAPHYYFLMTNSWLNSQTLTSGGVGTNVNGTPVNYSFPGDSDPLLIGSNGVEFPLWSEESASNLPGDRKGVASMGPFTLTPGATHYIDVAYVFARESDDNEEDNLDVFLDQRIVDARNFFNDYLFQCNEDQIILNTDENTEHQEISMYPNPSSGLINVAARPGYQKNKVAITDLTGKVVWTSTFYSGIYQIDVSTLSNGVYIVTQKSGSEMIMGKLIIQK